MNQASSVQIIGSDQYPSNRHSVSCAGCMLKGGCFPLDMDGSNVTAFNAIVQRARPLHKGDHVYRAAQPFTMLYAVRSGAFKAYSVSADGEEQVTQFYLPGEIFGMDGLSGNGYASSVVALETGAVCAIPFAQLRTLSVKMPALHEHLFRLLSGVIIRDQDLITQLGKYSAERRIARFLQRFSQYQAARRLSTSKIRLPMTRTDISGYLGLTVETVSRIFGRFQQMGLLTSEGREIEILNLDWLHEIADGQASDRNVAELNPARSEKAAIANRKPAVQRQRRVVRRTAA